MARWLIWLAGCDCLAVAEAVFGGRAPLRVAAKRVKGFEESLCELASLYVLRSMAEEWKVKAPYAAWKSFAPHLAEYATKRIDERTLPAGRTLAAWYGENVGALRKNPVDRDRNRMVAGALLGLFERSPEHWGAIRYLNQGKARGAMSFEAYLQNWHDRAPEEHCAFIGTVAGEFGITLR
jgi:hypothetical protein